MKYELPRKRTNSARQHWLTRFILHRKIAISTLITICLLISTPMFSVGLNEYMVSLSARPDVITADASSYTTITADVRDENGNRVPDGTMVEFSTSLGRIENRVPTSNGVARARFQSEVTSGVAMITAAVSSSRGVAELKVDVLPAGTKLETASSITVESKHQLLYDPERKLVDGIGGIKITTGSLCITGDSGLIDIGRRSIRIRTGADTKTITIKKDKKEITGSEAIIDLGRMTAILFGPVEEGAKRQFISLRNLEQKEEKDIRAVSGPAEPVSGALLIGADKVIIKSGKEIKLIGATFFLEGDKTIKMPFYRISLQGGGAKSFTYGSEGLRASIPLYLGLDENSSTAVIVTRQEQQGWGVYGGSKRWESDLVREYDTDDGASGQVVINRMGSSDWGLRWSGRNDFGDGLESYVYLDTPSHSDVYGNFDLSKTTSSYTSSFTFRGSHISNGRSRHYTGLSYQMRPRRIGSPLFTYSVSGRGFYDSSPNAVNNHLGGSSGFQLYLGPFDFLAGTSISTQGSITRIWGGSNPGKSAYSNASIYKDLGKNARMSVNYSYSWDDSETGGTYDTLSSDLYLSPLAGLSTHFSVIKGLRQGSTSSFGDMSYKITRDYSIRGLVTWQRYSGYSFTDSQIGIVRTMGSQEARLFYSKSRNRFLFEFSAAGL